jgi:hypothetical protein
VFTRAPDEVGKPPPYPTTWRSTDPIRAHHAIETSEYVVHWKSLFAVFADTATQRRCNDITRVAAKNAPVNHVNHLPVSLCICASDDTDNVTVRPRGGRSYCAFANRIATCNPQQPACCVGTSGRSRPVHIQYARRSIQDYVRACPDSILPNSSAFSGALTVLRLLLANA